jgi:hypothetical protein
VKLLPAIGWTVGGLWLLNKLSTAGIASRLNLYISSFNLSLSGISPIIQIGVMAQNVTNGSLQFNALAANAFLNGTMIGNVSGFQPVTIAPVSQVTIPLTVIVNATQIISDVISILTGSAGVAANLEIKGTANVSNLILPVDIIYKAI